MLGVLSSGKNRSESSKQARSGNEGDCIKVHSVSFYGSSNRRGSATQGDIAAGICHPGEGQYSVEPKNSGGSFMSPGKSVLTRAQAKSPRLRCRGKGVSRQYQVHAQKRRCGLLRRRLGASVPHRHDAFKRMNAVYASVFKTPRLARAGRRKRISGAHGTLGDCCCCATSGREELA